MNTFKRMVGTNGVASVINLSQVAFVVVGTTPNSITVTFASGHTENYTGSIDKFAASVQARDEEAPKEATEA